MPKAEVTVILYEEKKHSFRMQAVDKAGNKVNPDDTILTDVYLMKRMFRQKGFYTHKPVKITMEQE